MGVSSTDVLEWKGHSAHAAMGNIESNVANRLSYALGLTGPSYVIDSACSSSLVALDNACNNLRGGLCDSAVVGGVNLLLSSIGFDVLDGSGFLSPTFRCKAFNASADGYVRGEGCGAVVLMRLEDALEGNYRIEAVIRGTASIHNGTATHFAAPNPASQQKLIHRALNDAGVQAEDVCYVETHGTGTRHGDPIEFQALKSVFGKQRERPLVLGAIKMNIGHLEGAAGIAGIIKTILVLQRRASSPNLHLKTINPEIRLEGSSFTFPTEMEPLGTADGVLLA